MAKTGKNKEVKEVNSITSEATPVSGEVKPKKYVVISQFADKDNFSKLYNVGDDVSKFDADRIKDCLSKGLIKEEK